MAIIVLYKVLRCTMLVSQTQGSGCYNTQMKPLLQ